MWTWRTAGELLAGVLLMVVTWQAAKAYYYGVK